MTLAVDYRPHNGPAAWIRKIRRSLLELSQDEALYSRRGFPAPSLLLRTHFETIGRTFIAGYNMALSASNAETLRLAVDRVEPERRGFAAEGAVMGVAMLDAFRVGPPSLPRAIAVFDHDFTYLAHVGAGWAMARLPWRRRTIFKALNPVHHWLAYDGWGFHDTYFRPRSVLANSQSRKAAYSARAYDQGVGRGLWFLCGGSFERIHRTIATFAAGRHSDLWSGAGLAVAYAGPLSEMEALKLAKAAAGHTAALLQGIAFACEARKSAGHVPLHTKVAARAIAGSDVDSISNMVRAARESLSAESSLIPRYELWRQAVAERLVWDLGAMA